MGEVPACIFQLPWLLPSLFIIKSGVCWRGPCRGCPRQFLLTLFYLVPKRGMCFFQDDLEPQILVSSHLRQQAFLELFLIEWTTAT